jgi:probable HAF family extracellular repeat protein
MNRRTAQPHSSFRKFAILVVVPIAALYLFSACSDKPTAPVRADFSAATKDPTIVELWHGPGSRAYAVNPAGLVVGTIGTKGRPPFQVVLWDHGTLIEVANLCRTSTCEDLLTPIGINAAGQIVGTSVMEAFLWNRGELTNVGSLAGNISRASWINERGDVLGAVIRCRPDLPPYIRNLETTCAERAVLWRQGNPIDLAALGGLFSSAAGLNSAGTVAGTAELTHVGFGNSEVHAFVWQDGAMTDLGTLGGLNSSATGINAAGQVVGFSETADGAIDAVVWDRGSMTDLGEGRACAINAPGQIVGFRNGSAVMWDHGNMIPLGVAISDCTIDGGVPSMVINAAGQVAMNSCTATCSAYKWERGILTRLEDAGGGEATISDINPRGWIVGQSTDEAGEPRAVLWTH